MGGRHGIGIKRNDYHRRNRRANHSTWSRSHGYNKANRFDGAGDTEVEVTLMKKELLIANAIKIWEQAPDPERELEPRKRGEVALLFKCRLYARHYLTNYDELHKNATAKAYIVIAENVVEKVGKVYPFLRVEGEKWLARLRKTRRLPRIKVIKGKTLSQEQLDHYNAKEDENGEGSWPLSTLKRSLTRIGK